MEIELTRAAAEQIRVSGERDDVSGLVLRIAAQSAADGSLEYAMGFDELKDDDQFVDSRGVRIVVAPSSAEILDGMTVDFVEIEPGQTHFIFLNPNDPHYVPPKT
ncbi:MAG: iron-sulfur cluster assembly accessory protein [Gammaproteobacteria bacterium]|nr:iron-sulfur cluster assembly accessory protein [Gammaproteobacteria bacterium]